MLRGSEQRIAQVIVIGAVLVNVKQSINVQENIAPVRCVITRNVREACKVVCAVDAVDAELYL